MSVVTVVGRCCPRCRGGLQEVCVHRSSRSHSPIDGGLPRNGVEAEAYEPSVHLYRGLCLGCRDFDGGAVDFWLEPYPVISRVRLYEVVYVDLDGVV